MALERTRTTPDRRDEGLSYLPVTLAQWAAAPGDATTAQPPSPEVSDGPCSRALRGSGVLPVSRVRLFTVEQENTS